MGNVVRYTHHGRVVAVDEAQKGKHRDVCLCFRCWRFVPDDRAKNCAIANAVFGVCQQYGLVTPVWECPEFGEVQYGRENNGW